MVSVTIAEVLTLLTILYCALPNSYRQHFRNRLDNIDLERDVRPAPPEDVHIAVATPATRADFERSLGNRGTRDTISGPERLCNRPCQFCIGTPRGPCFCSFGHHARPRNVCFCRSCYEASQARNSHRAAPYRG